MATSPLNRRPSTKTGQIRSAPPAAKRKTPSQRTESPVERPDLVSIRVGGQICAQYPDQAEGDKDPAVAAILAFARAQISTSEERGANQETGGNRKGDPGRMGEEGSKARTASPRKARVPPTVTNASRGVIVMAASAFWRVRQRSVRSRLGSLFLTLPTRALTSRSFRITRTEVLLSSNSPPYKGSSCPDRS